MPLQLIPHLHRATHQVGLYIASLRDELDVSQAEAHVLAHLHEHGDSSIGALHASFGHKRSTLTSIINRLEQRQLVKRQLHPTDRRSYMLHLTRSGSRQAAQVHAALEALERAVLAQLSRAQRQAVAAALAAIEQAALPG